MIRELDLNDIKLIEKESENPFAKCFGYYIDDKLAGYIQYNDIYDSIDIVNVYVYEIYRGQGIGSMLLEELVMLARNDKKKNITLEVSSLNSVAIGLYEKFGFKQVAVRKGYYKGTDGYLMELIL